SGIVYCATRKAVDELYDYLPRYGFSVTRYHAGLEDDLRRRNQDDFIYDRKPVMIATNAFGMGIDKSNVNFVIHYNMPKNIESYYQEAGRAGRDGSPACCTLLYNGQDVHINEYLITHSEDENEADPKLLEHSRELLKQMTFYATGNECLRRRLLGYFGEDAPVYCGNCSVCLTEYEETDITLEARKIISCVYRLKQRNRNFGKTMIIDILRGGKSEKIKRSGLDSLSVWGIMAETDPRRVRAVLDYLIDENFLAGEGDEYPVVVLGRGYEEILREERRLFMKLPGERGKEELKKRDGKGLKLKTPAASVNLLPLANEEPREAEMPESFDRALFEKLKELRKEIAAKEGVPAYIVFTDASLRDMCRKRPESLAQFSAVNGVGSVKLEKYGKAFVEAMKKEQ
ncbi:MAG: HRDC domain-containing protein, partial [Treponema sp.]|nr:HRDC domain-containing protein [Treponema sp.]